MIALSMVARSVVTSSSETASSSSSSISVASELELSDSEDFRSIGLPRFGFLQNLLR